MASEMPVVNAEFGDRPTIEFPTEIAPAGLKVVELFEGNGPMVPRSTPAATVTSRPRSASVWDRSSRAGIRPFRDTTSVPAWWCPFRRSTVMAPVVFRRPASAARTRWCS